jgi:hypothetical protein
VKGCVQIWGLGKASVLKTGGSGRSRSGANGLNGASASNASKGKGRAVDSSNDAQAQGQAQTGDDAPELQCLMVICHDSGPAHEIKWCPLPCDDDVSAFLLYLLFAHTDGSRRWKYLHRTPHTYLASWFAMYSYILSPSSQPLPNRVTHANSGFSQERSKTGLFRYTLCPIPPTFDVKLLTRRNGIKRDLY